MSLIIHVDPVPLAPDDTGTIRVAGTRVTLDTVIEQVREGASAEEIASRFPVLEVADVHAVMAYYFRHRSEVESYLDEQAGLAQASMAEVHSIHQSWTVVSKRLQDRQNGGVSDDASLPR
jgi:uncharacterized protein (DUF433 family)